MKLNEANKNYKKGEDYLKTSCLKCRFESDYTSAIPYFKSAADDYHTCGNFEKELDARKKLVKCFQNEKSYWEEGNEYEKISRVQLEQLKSPSDSYNSIENAFNAYINNHTYDDAIKALNKSSNNFIDKENKKEAEKVLDFAFDGINKYYHVIILDKDEDCSYVYECIDKYIDLLFDQEKYKKCAEISKKSAELIENENIKEKRVISKYYAYQALAELLDKKDDKFPKTIEKGIKFESGENGLCHKIKKLINIVKEHNNNNQKLITSLFYDISSKVPNSVSKKLYKFIEENKVNNDNNNNINNDYNNDKNTDFEEDMK